MYLFENWGERKMKKSGWRWLLFQKSTNVLLKVCFYNPGCNQVPASLLVSKNGLMLGKWRIF